MKKEDKTFRVSLVVALVVAVIMGFVSGVVGELWVNDFLAPDLEFKSYHDLTKRIDELLGEKNSSIKDLLTGHDAAFNQTIEEIEPITATFYLYQKAGVGLNDQYLANEVLGSGFVLTSDGWIVTTTNVVTNPKRDYVVEVGGDIYQVTDIVADSMTPAVLVKIAANNLSVANLGSKNSVHNSQSVIVASKISGMERANINKVVYMRAESSSDLVHSSETYYRFIKLGDSFSAEYVGAPVVNLDGKVVAVLLNRDGEALPIDYLARVMKTAVQSGNIDRNLLGVNYIDLIQAVNFEANVDAGALLFDSNGRAAVIHGTPAYLAGLRAGDVIMKVDGDEINERQSLTELIQEYNVGSKVQLTIIRGEEELKIDVQLDKLISN
ncbi:hypothetical protein COT97_04785 [Candidatus Falkowbacteria bacterium CG10_big_fil_rev_8_21_14_0_10_39_11]|uniref:PDZ domain-containing protein n=1 Tax=Candidatus Falkowbacteria bacterium CG10_big_fil_rev_8_21_14_0_10_39_11 TaxID=1974565 RepID=A0A2H0V3V6_9BACT|nr:MAG: hypothetical protein COT97_04785 [Candidatus Falkowbacteria bacterium CG10_big_fil_rev_8_21_14_0_10_39_11]